MTYASRRSFRAAALFLIPVGGSGYADRVGEDGNQAEQANEHILQVMQLLPARAIDNGLYVFFANQVGHSGNDCGFRVTAGGGPDGTFGRQARDRSRGHDRGRGLEAGGRGGQGFRELHGRRPLSGRVREPDGPMAR